MLASYQFSDSREVVYGNNAVGSGTYMCVWVRMYLSGCVDVSVWVCRCICVGV